MPNWKNLHIKIKVSRNRLESPEGGRGIALHSLDLGTTPRPLTPRKDPVPIVQEAGWAPVPVWTCEKNLAPTEIRSPDRPAIPTELSRPTKPTYAYKSTKEKLLNTKANMWFNKMCRLNHAISWSDFDTL
jgi:hypothetical protein